MTEHDMLMQEILLSPDDDTPRLLYADWCKNNDRLERAEFIWAQLEIARVGTYQCNEPEDCYYANDCVNGCPGKELDQHIKVQQKFIKKRGFTLCDGLLGPLWRTEGRSTWIETAGVQVRYFRDGWASYGPYTFIVRRGFIDRVICSRMDWLGLARWSYWHPSAIKSWTGAAQPIQRVRLWPNRSHETVDIPSGHFVSTPLNDSEFTHSSWPGVIFELPRTRSLYNP